MRRYFLLPLLLLLSGLLLGASQRYLEHVRYLADDRLQGRGNGSPEILEAAEYIARHFRASGLQPAGDSGSYYQDFPLLGNLEPDPSSQLSIRLGDEAMELKPGQDFQVLSYGEESRVEGPLAFAGFGITALSLGYDDYGELEARGKVVVVFEHEPQERFPGSPFAGTRPTSYGTYLYKIMHARSRGAVAVLFLPDPFNHPEGSMVREVPVAASPLGIPALRLGAQPARRLLEAGAFSPQEINRSIHGRLIPRSFRYPDASASLFLVASQPRTRLRNVLGFLPGREEEVVVVGAHYDHLGWGQEQSGSQSSMGKIHNGADDNASGTAGLLMLAERFSARSLRRGLLFAAFSGEEMGLLGSKYLVEKPPLPLHRVVAMLNLDMIGRSQGTLFIGGVGTSPRFAPILQRVQRNTPLEFRYSQSPAGSSDHLPFALQGIPVLFFFTGLHSDYHKPSDDWEKIDVQRSLQVLAVVEEVLAALEAEEGEALRPGPGQGWTGLRSELDGFSSLGVVLDPEWRSEGIRVQEVQPSTPAAAAGLQPGDVILEVDGELVASPRGFWFRLNSQRDPVEVVLLREGDLSTTRLGMEPKQPGGGR